MSEQSRTPSFGDEPKAIEGPRAPTEIVVYRAGSEAGEGTGWHAAHDGFAAAPEPRRRGWSGRVVALVAVAMLVGVAGASLAAGLGSLFAKSDQQPAVQVASADELKSAREAIKRLEGQVAALKAEAEKTAKTRTAQLGKLGERLDKADKAYEDTAARLAKLAEAQDKDRKVMAAAADVTGSVPKAAAREPDKQQVVAGWRLNRIVRGGAEVEFDGVRYAVYPGDPLPGVGTVAGLKRGEDGRWAVVTSKGLILGQ